MPFRVGFGFDTHSLESGRLLILGGVKIPSDSGFTGHSDGDALIHAVIDALLGAACMGDIGTHFPDTDLNYKDIDSSVLLIKAMELVKSTGYTVVNIDITVCLERPKINPHVISIRQNLSGYMALDIDAISVKAKTSERLGFIGRSEGASVYAVALLEK